MSAGKRGARAGAAAFALGLALSGPHAATAAADPAEPDPTPAASAAQEQPEAGPVRIRPSRPGQTRIPGLGGARRGREVPGGGAADGASRPPLPTKGPRAHRGAAARPTISDQGGDAAPAAGRPRTVPPAPAAATPLDQSSNVAPAPRRVRAAAVTPSGLLDAVTPRPAAGSAVTAGAVPPALTKPVAAIGTTVTRFFDTAAHWLSGLPRGPVTTFLEGALERVRRQLFERFPALGDGRTVGSSAAFSGTEMRDSLLGLAKQQYGGLFGQTVPVYDHGPYPEYLKYSSWATDSDTNTQVQGVDEADFVENDGDYIYVAHNGQLRILRPDLSVASESALSGDVVGEYLSGDRLTVISQSGSGWYGPWVKIAGGHWQPWKPQTTITVYDVTDRTAPTVVRQTVFDGAYQSSRSVDGVVYLVMQRSVNLPAPAYTDVPVQYLDSGSPAAASAIRYDPDVPTAYRTYETWDQYVARVGGRIVDLSLPHAYSVDDTGATVDLGVITADVTRTDFVNQPAVLTVVSVDSRRDPGGPAYDAGVAGMVSAQGGTVYMTPEALYVATVQDRYDETVSTTESRIDRFAVDGTRLVWTAKGTVPGTLLNQFAMDEHDGYLRVATHTTESALGAGGWTTRDDNGIHVLDTAGGTLDEVGAITGLAPGEQLYAARFIGDTAYLVTFLRTDPLFAVDLSDPADPVLRDELVVPGFSNYLQSVGDGLLLGIGQERSAGTSDTHLHATLFDVSDPDRLTEIERVYLDPGYQWSWSDAQFDHHALLYTAQDGLLVVPVSGSGYDPQTGYRSGQYLKVLRVGPDGIEVVGEIHPDEPTLRTVRIGDVLYAVGDTSVSAYRLSDLSAIGPGVPASAEV
ncbi:MAG: beta-propeller domain-containing protein [Mycobacterium sp.]